MNVGRELRDLVAEPVGVLAAGETDRRIRERMRFDGGVGQTDHGEMTSMGANGPTGGAPRSRAKAPAFTHTRYAADFRPLTRPPRV